MQGEGVGDNESYVHFKTHDECNKGKNLNLN